MRREASVLHLDLDAFFASVEQRDKPSAARQAGGRRRCRPARRGGHRLVRGPGLRRPLGHARVRGTPPLPARCLPRGTFRRYRAASSQVMDLLRELSPLVEPLSLDEAFVDLMAARRPVDLSFAGVSALVDELRTRVATVTGGLTASVGVGTSKFIAKVASELAKPDGSRIVEPGTEVALLAPMSVGVIPGVGPVTAEKLGRIGIRTVADLQGYAVDELAQTVGRAHAQGLVDLAYARDIGRSSRSGRPSPSRLRTPSRPISPTRPSCGLCCIASPGRSPPGLRRPACSPGPSRSRSGCPTFRPSPARAP